MSNNILIEKMEVEDTLCDKNHIDQCPYCHDRRIIKYGKFNNNQRYKCKNEKCLKTFSTKTFSPWKYSKKSMKQWNNYIKLMADGNNLRECAIKSNITLTTSFYWRHKLLEVMNKVNDEAELSGYIEMTKMMIKENCKGSRSSKKMKNKIMVVTAMDSDNKSFSKVVSTMPADIKVINEKVFKSISSTGYVEAYLDRNLSVLAERHNKINNLHRDRERSDIPLFYLSQRKWLLRFKGIATKHLKAYMSWFALVFKNNDIKEYINLNLNENSIIKSREIRNRVCFQ